MRSMRLEDDKSLDDASTVELANNLLTAMSAMTPDAIANIVNANLQPLPLVPVEVFTIDFKTRWHAKKCKNCYDLNV